MQLIASLNRSLGYKVRVVKGVDRSSGVGKKLRVGHAAARAREMVSSHSLRVLYHRRAYSQNALVHSEGLKRSG